MDSELPSRSESTKSSSGGSTEYLCVNTTNDATMPETIAISSVLLRPTVAFDTFWRFAAERKAIDDKRRAGEPAP